MTRTSTVLVALLATGGVLAGACGATDSTTDETDSTTDGTDGTAGGTESTAASGRGAAQDVVEVVDVLDPVHDRPFSVALWRPESAPNDQLIVISHGFAGDNSSHETLAEGLVELGYMVAAPTHPDLAGLESGQADLEPLTLRPRHLSLVIDHVTAETDRSYDQITVVGHSMGAYAALRLAGVDPDVGPDTYCSANAADPVLCSAAARSRIDGLVAAPPPAYDQRVDRVVLLAPAYGPLFSDEALSGVEPKTLVIRADSDTEVPAVQVEQLLAGLASSTEYQTVSGGHFVFLRPCTAEELASFPQLCTDPEGTDRAAIQDELVEAIAGFVGR